MYIIIIKLDKTVFEKADLKKSCIRGNKCNTYV